MLTQCCIKKEEKSGTRTAFTMAIVRHCVLNDAYLCVICVCVLFLRQICDIPGLCQQEYFSYVCFDINTKVLEITEQSASVRGTHCSIKQ